MRQEIICTIVVLFTGCAHPDKVVTSESPSDGLFYTIEEYHAAGPVSDTDRVYARFQRHGKSSKMLVLDGGDLTITSIRWTTPTDVTLCVDGGVTNTFRNQVTLFAGDESLTVNNHIDEHCI